VRRSPSKYWVWWYLCIAFCFLLLAIVHLLRGEGMAPFALRIGVAAGFALLAWMQFG